MFDVLLGIAMLVAIIWWLGRDTSPSRPPSPKTPPAPPPVTSSRITPPAGRRFRPPEATRGDDAFVDGLIIGAYYFDHWGRDADEARSDPLPGLGDDDPGGDDGSEDGDDWTYDPSGYDYGAAGDTAEDDFDEFADDEPAGGFDDPFGFDDDFDF